MERIWRITFLFGHQKGVLHSMKFVHFPLTQDNALPHPFWIKKGLAFECEALTLSTRVLDELQRECARPSGGYIIFIPGVPTRQPKVNPRTWLVRCMSGNKGEVHSVDSIENERTSHLAAAMVDPRGNVW